MPISSSRHFALNSAFQIIEPSYSSFQQDPWRHSQNQHQIFWHTNSNPHCTSRIATTSHGRSCDGYHISLQHLHRQAQHIRRNSSAIVCQPWNIRCLEVAKVSYPYFQHFHQSVVPTQTHGGSIWHGFSGIRVDFFIFSSSASPSRRTPESLIHSALRDDNSNNCEAAKRPNKIAL